MDGLDCLPGLTMEILPTIIELSKRWSFDKVKEDPRGYIEDCKKTGLPSSLWYIHGQKILGNKQIPRELISTIPSFPLKTQKLLISEGVSAWTGEYVTMGSGSSRSLLSPISAKVEDAAKRIMECETSKEKLFQNTRIHAEEAGQPEKIEELANTIAEMLECRISECRASTSSYLRDKCSGYYRAYEELNSELKIHATPVIFQSLVDSMSEWKHEEDEKLTVALPFNELASQAKNQLNPQRRARVMTIMDSVGRPIDEEATGLLIDASDWLSDHPNILSISIMNARPVLCVAISKGSPATLSKILDLGANLFLAFHEDSDLAMDNPFVGLNSMLMGDKFAKRKVGILANSIMSRCEKGEISWEWLAKTMGEAHEKIKDGNLAGMFQEMEARHLSMSAQSGAKMEKKRI